MQIVHLDRLPPHARSQLYPPTMQPRLGDLAVSLFGTVAGIELDLPRHPPHEPLELGQSIRYCRTTTGYSRYGTHASAEPSTRR